MSVGAELRHRRPRHLPLRRARRGGFPANRILEIGAHIDPSTAGAVEPTG
jgi:hypothetical protein